MACNGQVRIGVRFARNSQHTLGLFPVALPGVLEPSVYEGIPRQMQLTGGLTPEEIDIIQERRDAGLIGALVRKYCITTMTIMNTQGVSWSKRNGFCPGIVRRRTGKGETRTHAQRLAVVHDRVGGRLPVPDAAQHGGVAHSGSVGDVGLGAVRALAQGCG